MKLGLLPQYESLHLHKLSWICHFTIHSTNLTIKMFSLFNFNHFKLTICNGIAHPKSSSSITKFKTTSLNLDISDNSLKSINLAIKNPIFLLMNAKNHGLQWEILKVQLNYDYWTTSVHSLVDIQEILKPLFFLTHVCSYWTLYILNKVIFNNYFHHLIQNTDKNTDKTFYNLHDFFSLSSF